MGPAGSFDDNAPLGNQILRFRSASCSVFTLALWKLVLAPLSMDEQMSLCLTRQFFELGRQASQLPSVLQGFADWTHRPCCANGYIDCEGLTFAVATTGLLDELSIAHPLIRWSLFLSTLSLPTWSVDSTKWRDIRWTCLCPLQEQESRESYRRA